MSIFDSNICSNDIIEAYIHKHYKLSQGYLAVNNPITIREGVVDIHCNIELLADSGAERLLPEGYRFGKIYGGLSCVDCASLKTLEGAPMECDQLIIDGCKFSTLTGLEDCVCRAFSCSGCNNLRSLEGSPIIKVGILCERCVSLKDIKGLSAYNGKLEYVICDFSHVETLDGIEDIYIQSISCRFCTKLKTIEAVHGCGSLDVAGTLISDLRCHADRIPIISCVDCKNINTFEGMPKADSINISGCNASSFKGMPSHIRNLVCRDCSNLKTAEYIPEVDGVIVVHNCPFMDNILYIANQINWNIPERTLRKLLMRV